MNATHVVSVAIVIGITVGGALMHGSATRRWSDPAALDELKAQAESLPRQLGAWEFVEAPEVREDILGELKADSFVQRIYRNVVSGDEVSFFLLLGPPGPVGAHTPEICYPAQKFTTTSNRKSIAFGESADGEKQTLWRMTFRTQDVFEAPLEVYFGWSDGGPWQAASAPRLTFGNAPYLWKLQLAYFPKGVSKDESPAQQFLHDELLPALAALGQANQP